jgi:hypothetical protein
MWHPYYDLDNLATEGKISDSRIVVDHTRESLYRGQIFYRTEALVSYEIDGQAQNRWLIASEITTERTRLASNLRVHQRVAKPTGCLITLKTPDVDSDEGK